MAAIPQSHEPRVTARGVRLTSNGRIVQVSTRSDFVAPELSPVRTIDLELERGLAGWTDTDTPPPAEVWQIRAAKAAARALAARELEEFTVGTTVIRKVPPRELRRIHRTGPRRKAGK